MSLLKAVFAAGCFWGVQAKFDAVPGVVSTEVGYTGGTVVNPSYEEVCGDATGHAEAVEVVYDPSKTDYNKLLDVFFTIHDPTALNRQGPDIGSQYRSAVFYTNDDQRDAALRKIKVLDQSGRFKAPIVTEVTAVSAFYPAEEYHQKYLFKRGRTGCGSSCAVPPDVWKEKLGSEEYRILREKGTERPFTGRYLNYKEDGTYTCAACGNPIFRSDRKFDSGSGWPSFDQALPGGIKTSLDLSHGMVRHEVVCAVCGSHLGHVFADGPTETGNRFCINSVSMGFKKTDQ